MTDPKIKANRPKSRKTKDGPSSSPDQGSSTEPLFFYMPDARYGEFCQWYPSVFTVSTAKIRALVGDDAVEADQKHWGENRLGKALMAVRKHFQIEEGEGEVDWMRMDEVG